MKFLAYIERQLSEQMGSSCLFDCCNGEDLGTNQDTARLRPIDLLSQTIPLYVLPSLQVALVPE